MDVHPPHEPIHTWRAFFIHLITITIGLLIALGLEGLVEMRHHANLAKEARADLREEMSSNQHKIAANLAEIRADEDRIHADIQTLLMVEAGKKDKPHSLAYNMKWSEFSDSAWKTTRSSGAIAYLEFENERDLDEVYDKQELVSARAKEMERDHARAAAPIFIRDDPDKATAQELQLCLQRSADLQMDLHTLEQWLQQLNEKYLSELKEL